MTLKEFNKLDEMEQYEAWIEHATYVCDRVEQEYRVALYKFPTFYIELYYHIEHNVLKKLKTITIEEMVSPYRGLN